MRKKNRKKAKKGRKTILKTAMNQTGYLHKVNDSSGASSFTGNSWLMKRNEAPETDQNSTSIDILMLLFTAVFHPLVEETRKKLPLACGNT
jgi:hypothetical protein